MANQNYNQNQLETYRRRMHFKPKQVARLLGHKETSILGQFERGRRLPSLVNAFRLSIILRVPVEFLYPALYDCLRLEIRHQEERLSHPTQQPLF